jgi:hypothetical protein
MVTRLGIARMASVVVRGAPNAPLPEPYKVNRGEFLEGAAGAAGLVTRAAAEGDWAGLEGLLEPACAARLREQLDAMAEEERGLVVLNPADVFLSFISNPHNCEEGCSLILVTYSLPGLEQVKLLSDSLDTIKEQSEKETMSNIMTGDIQTPSQIWQEAKKVKVEIKQTHKEQRRILKNNKIVIGNYRLVRTGVTGEWTISELGQTPLETAFHLPFSFRWRTLLEISCLTGTAFLKLLRFDLMMTSTAAILTPLVQLAILQYLWNNL